MKTLTALNETHAHVRWKAAWFACDLTNWPQDPPIELALLRIHKGLGSELAAVPPRVSWHDFSCAWGRHWSPGCCCHIVMAPVQPAACTFQSRPLHDAIRLMKSTWIVVDFPRPLTASDCEENQVTNIRARTLFRVLQPDKGDIVVGKFKVKLDHW